MRLGVIDRDEFRQYRYWETFQKIVLPFIGGFFIAGWLLEGVEVRRLSAAVGVLLSVMFLYSVWAAGSLKRRMVRELPPSLQSLLLFSAEAPQMVVAAAEAPPPADAQ